jgi:hypothetical protein
MTYTAKHPAAFINALSEGPKADVIEWLQRTWDELQDLRSSGGARTDQHKDLETGQQNSLEAGEKCPDCDGSGSYPDPRNGEQTQCEWCYRNAPSPEPSDRIWREMLAYAYSGTNLYTDDGELSDGSVIPVIDYLRMTPEQIQAAIRRRGGEKLRAEIVKHGGIEAAMAAAKSSGEPGGEWVGKHVIAEPMGHVGIVRAIWKNTAWLHYDCGGASTYDVSCLRLVPPESDDWCHEHGHRQHKRGSPACELAADKARSTPTKSAVHSEKS